MGRPFIFAGTLGGGGGEAWSFILTLTTDPNEVTIGAFNWLFSVIRSAKSNSRNHNRQTEISHFRRPWRRSVKRFMQWHTIFLLVKYFLVTSNSQWNWRKALQSFGVFLHLLQHSNVQTPQQARNSCFHLSQLLNSLEDSIYILFSVKQFLYSRESIITIWCHS